MTYQNLDYVLKTRHKDLLKETDSSAAASTETINMPVAVDLPVFGLSKNRCEVFHVLLHKPKSIFRFFLGVGFFRVHGRVSP